ncbi:colicin E3-like toxin immunity protein [Pseudomonas brassicacearum]|jgi:Cloacin immunity protein.|uniref:colicin E3-like toxin immunity protein n=1 Tax=Pseudomonas brassicacearum TaxID=930166 RepID=UPI00025FE892|nr:colicin E3-like toxin immunity protein [Pseudomonas brassicacearum]EIK70121.1 immunity protein, cloacin/colicin family [Pseudomonas fluorescens Q8r1-96]KAB0525418.1 cloacin [Pseudomonas brassicacearum subsp. brassicacearum]NJP64419.1 cloacin [Pseudomonas brassicacearum]QEO76937.1 cloacin [Pseudomonas brassicacearum]UVM45593.1 cloacin immunity family protein [Pseudomonas brassicacearum]
MGLKIRLDWYDKKTELGEGKEYSNDLGDDLSVITALDLESEPEIYDGGFDVRAEWIPIIQPFFEHSIAPEKFDYQIAFRYRANW